MSESQVLTHKCPNCGGPLLFEPKNQKFHCEYCGSTFTEQEVSDFEAKQEAAKVTDSPISSVSNAETTDEKEKITDSDQKRADENTDEEIGLFLCPSCGAEIVTDATTASTWCYYCHNPVVLTERLSGKFLPEKILPFQIERKAAEEQFLDWVGKKKFVPKAFFDKKQIHNLNLYYLLRLTKADCHRNIHYFICIFVLKQSIISLIILNIQVVNTLKSGALLI